MITPDEYYRLRELDLRSDEQLLTNMENQLQRALVEMKRRPFIDTNNWQTEEIERAQELAKEHGWRVEDGRYCDYPVYGFYLVKPPPEKQSWLSRIFQ